MSIALRKTGQGFSHWIGRLLPPITAVVLLTSAVVSAVAILPGTEQASSPVERGSWIAAHRVQWTAGWLVTEFGMLLLAGFFAWWAVKIHRPLWAVMLIAVDMAAVLLDSTGIIWFITRVPIEGELAYRQATLITAGFATALYCLVGLVLTANTAGLSRRIVLLSWCCWLAGLGLVLSTFARSSFGTCASAAVMWTTLPCVCVGIGIHYGKMR